MSYVSGDGRIGNEQIRLQAERHAAKAGLRMRVRLTHKFAELINGIDLSKAHEGELLELTDREAQMLLAEGWAEYEGGVQPRSQAHETPGQKRRGRRKKP